MTALRRTARRKTADLSAVIPTTVALGIALAIVPLSVHAETKVRGTAAPQTTPTAAADNAKRPVPVPGSGGPTPPIRAAHGPAPVLTPPPPGTTAPIPVPEIGPGPAPAPMPLQPAAVRTPAPLLPTASPAAAPTIPAPAPSPTKPTWVAQLIGESSETVALSRFRQMQGKLRSPLGGYQPAILRTRLKDGTIWVRVRVEFDTRQAAEALCSKLEAAGAPCLVQRNSER
jgi:hypothetical protein